MRLAKSEVGFVHQVCGEAGIGSGPRAREASRVLVQHSISRFVECVGLGGPPPHRGGTLRCLLFAGQHAQELPQVTGIIEKRFILIRERETPYALPN